MIRIWHRNVSSRDEAIFPVNFTHVADVNVDSLGWAFQFTNHIDSNWCEGAMISNCAEPNRTRSSSVGDIFERDGELYMVAPNGFVEVDPHVTLPAAADIEY